MGPNALARTLISVTCASVAGAILGFIAATVLPLSVFGVILVLVGAIAGAAVGWQWAATAPAVPETDDQGADYDDAPPGP